MNNSRFYLKAFSLFSATLCALVAVGLYFLLAPVVTDPQGYHYELRKGTSKKLFAAEMVQQGVVSYPSLFSFYIYLHPHAQLKSGEYYFAKGSTLLSIWQQVTTGTGLVYHQFTIIPGWTFNQLRQQLEKEPALRHLMPSLDDKQVMNLLGHVELAPEGEFFPETYYFSKDTADLVILKRAFDLMQNKLNDAWEHHESGLPYKNVYEALIVASLVEKEAYLNAERPIIAGVIVNRLQVGMLLQIDPTVVYGLGARYDGKIHRADLLEDTVYNTYKRKGLPPTPIAMPSFASIDAAMHPQHHDYFYFVAKGDGAHQFSKTLVAHHAAVMMAANLKPTWYFNEMRVRHILGKLFADALGAEALGN